MSLSPPTESNTTQNTIHTPSHSITTPHHTPPHPNPTHAKSGCRSPWTEWIANKRTR